MASRTKKIFEHNESGDRWYVGGVMNTCFNCVDRHVEAGNGARIAFIHDSPMTGTKSQISYAELLDRVQCVATMMQDKGIEKGDRVIIYMPMIVETAIAALACARPEPFIQLYLAVLQRLNWPHGWTMPSRNWCWRRLAVWNRGALSTINRCSTVPSNWHRISRRLASYGNATKRRPHLSMAAILNGRH